MKLSQAVDLYIQRKRDAGMRFDSPMRRLRSPLWRYRSSPHHDTADHRLPRRFGQYAQRMEWQARLAAVLFRLLDSAWSAEILSPATFGSQNHAELRSVYLLAVRLALSSGCCPALPTEIGLRHVGSNLSHAVAVSVWNWHAARRSTSAPGHGPGSHARSGYDTRYEVLQVTPRAPRTGSREAGSGIPVSAGTTKSTLSIIVSSEERWSPCGPGCRYKLLASATDRRHRTPRRLVLPTEAS